MRLLVVGGSDAGIEAGRRALELDPDAEVRLVVADGYPNFSICGLPFYISGETPDWRDLAHRDADELARLGLDLLLEHTAVAVDPAAHQLVVRPTRGGPTFTLGYDRLVIGTGARAVRPPIEGIDLPGVRVLRTMDHAHAVRDRVDAARRAVVVGGGYIGVEMADALTHRGLRVSLLEMGPQVLATVDGQLGALVADELADNGVDVRTGVRVEAIQRGVGGLEVLAGDERLPAELVVVATGATPNAALGAAAGVPTGAGGALRVDRRMRTGLADVFAAGDCVHTHHRLLAEPTYLPLGTTAHKQGRVAGDNAAGGHAVFAGSLGTQVVKVFDAVVARTGLRHDEATAAGFRPETVDTTADDHKAYYPGASKVHIRVTADRRDGRLLGAQLFGARGAQVAKRVDIYATAIFNQMSVEAIGDLDLSYTPPLSAPWDPVQTAAQTWQRQHAPHGQSAEPDSFP